MIPYLEILNKYTLKQFGLVEPNDCWFELSYYDIGQFEVYCRATQKNLIALQKGNYIKIPNRRFVWVITSIEYTTTEKHTKMISAKGFEAKWLLNKRIIKNPVDLPTTLSQAVYDLVNNNASWGAESDRRIQNLNVARLNDSYTIPVTQATRGNLATYTNALLKTYGYGSQICYEADSLVFRQLKGTDKSEYIKFSQSFDNLLTSKYFTDDSNKGTCINVVAKVDDVEYPQHYTTNVTGVDCNEVYLESNLATKYEDIDGNEHELDLTNTTDLATYNSWLVEEGKKELLANHKTVEEINGTIDLINSHYEFDTDFYLGDKVRIQDEYFNFFVDKIILKYTISQSSNGYSESADYGE